jgi:hypothetical protein
MRKRLRREGIEAIFSNTREKRDPSFLIGLSAITAGATSWTILVIDRYAKPFAEPIISSYMSILLSSFGILLVVGGIGICTAFPTVRQEAGHDDTQGSIDSLRADILSNGKSLRSRIGESGRSRIRIISDSTKYGVVAFVQSCFAIALYGGLTDEYQSNIVLLHWVQTVFPSASYLLTWQAVLITAAIFGVVVSQFTPGRVLAE